MNRDADRPGHLRPVPAPGVVNEAVAREIPAPGGIRGLTAPRARSHSGRFITDVIVDLGYLSKERVEQVIAEARSAGRSRGRPEPPIT